MRGRGRLVEGEETLGLESSGESEGSEDSDEETLGAGGDEELKEDSEEEGEGELDLSFVDTSVRRSARKPRMLLELL